MFLLASGLRVGALPICGPFSARPAAPAPPPATPTVAMDADMNPDSETMDPDMEAAIEAACAAAELEAACMNGEAEEEELEDEYRRNEEEAYVNEEDADTRQAQLINPGLSGDEADSMLSDRKRTALSSGSSSSGEDSSDEGVGGGKKKKIRKRKKKKKKTSAAAADADDDDDVRRKNLIGFIGLKNYHKSHATMPTEQLHLVWSKIKQWDELLLKFYAVQGAKGSGETRKKTVRSRLAALEQRMRELVQEKRAIEEGDHDHMQECVEADNAELSTDQMLSAAAGDARRLVGSGVRELAAETNGGAGKGKKARVDFDPGSSDSDGDSDDDDGEDEFNEDDMNSFNSIDDPAVEDEQPGRGVAGACSGCSCSGTCA